MFRADPYSSPYRQQQGRPLRPPLVISINGHDRYQNCGIKLRFLKQVCTRGLTKERLYPYPSDCLSFFYINNGDIDYYHYCNVTGEVNMCGM